MLTDEDIYSRLMNVEDATVERKTAGDYRDVTKAAVAFANSLPLGEAAIIYVGVYDHGEIENTPKGGMESLLKKVSGELNNIYPPILTQLVVREKGDRHFIAVIVTGSENTPHSAGKSYIREGSKTVEASENEFSVLIDRRAGKTNEILKWREKLIKIDMLDVEENIRRSGRVRITFYRVVHTCNQFFVTLKEGHDRPDRPRKLESFPLKRVEISHDDEKDTLSLEIYPL
jgi:predicted HTH transcriptional regulator